MQVQSAINPARPSQASCETQVCHADAACIHGCNGSIETTGPNPAVSSTALLAQSAVLAFEFPDLVDRIQREMSLPAEEAQALFKDMLQFLYLCGTHRGERQPFYPPHQIDEAWHTFLLFTREYDAFCRFHFGAFIHHSPVTPTNRARHQNTPKNLASSLAREVFGTLSKNWTTDAADCPQSCCPSFDDCNLL